ncbi:hypothetical protein N7499_006512 [Penicillium canescens]|uniref:Uncharacterized protein n=1 Tax=Penicillium canescens TaxID=5083 RepID=A0AAD6N9J2_PENCN|nr:uncharacterized protein N7446_002203 [Penicillium canescens]KAJ5997180.1 hypothetical protein N7522_008840 [Penicillium canescens]KAJ6044007.1 hypothetical protein N7460_005362 [Penicillium canescens]KAJ6055479.1 hypothetical protein N7444_004577 [Penicillium canescens]KAJ6074426.1 hypothetical protein N7446_002203 [Penicillium canescens]KAJ6081638.1 hypothetical protein N7499_006512 [Penicillium canescens]
MDKPKNNQETQTQGSQEKKGPQLRSVEEYQKYWDQLLQNTADQIQKIRDKEQAAERSTRDSHQ